MGSNKQDDHRIWRHACAR